MSILKTVATIGGYTGLSRVLGMVREILMSHFLGAGVIADAFVVAFKFPNFFRRFFAEGAFNAAFIPIFAGELAEKGEGEAKKIATDVFSVMTFFLMGFCLLVIIFAPVLVHIFAPGFATTAERMTLAVDFTRITFFYMLFISLTALLGGILNSLNAFGQAAAVPIVLNIAMITALLVAHFFEYNPGYSLSWGVFVAGILQFLWLYLACIKKGFFLKLQKPLLSDKVKHVLKRMGPGTFGAGVMQVNIFLDLVLASFLPTGALSYLYYADRLNQLPLSIFGIAMSTALLPLLSKYLRMKEQHKARTTTDAAIQFSMQLTAPASLGLVVLAYPIIGLIYGHGKFDENAINATAPTLGAFALGLPAYVVGRVLATYFFAHEDTKTPVKMALISVFVNLIGNLILIKPLGHVGLALSTAVAAWVNGLLLARVMHKRGWYTLWHKSMILFLGKLTVACGVMAFVLGLALGLEFFIKPCTVLMEVMHVVCLSGLGVVVYILACKALNIMPSLKNLK